MQQWDTVAIVGVGLIGGSVGLALRRRGLARQVVGIGRSRQSLQVAEKSGAVTRSTLELAEGVSEAQLVVICTPVGRIVDDVRAAAAACPPGTLLTDVGSTKAQIVAALDEGFVGHGRFVGSHPLAGGEKNGPGAAMPDLLEGRTVVVTPGRATREEDCAAIEGFWNSLGARVVRMTPAEHDRALAGTSHLPHLAAAALVAATPRDDLRLVASGWLDTTRTAAGDPALWQQIFLSNRDQMLIALERYEMVLVSWRRSLEQGDEQGLTDLLAEAKQKRDAVAS